MNLGTPGRALLGLIALVFLSGVAHAEGRFYGMLRSRDLTPFGFLRLDMRPAHAISIESHTWAIETEYAHQNTWALSPAVEHYLVGLESQGRRGLGPQEVADIQALPGENYLVDLESSTLDVAFHYKISSQWSAYLIATLVTYQGGFLDSSIEGFHDAFGFSTFGRPAIARNRTNLLYDLKSSQVVLLGEPDTTGLADPTFGLRYSGIQLSGKWEMSLETAVKVPFNGRRLFLSTGRTDYGFQASLRRLGSFNGLHIDLSAVYYAGEEMPVHHEAQIIPTIVVGWERILTDRTNLNLQAYASRSVYRNSDTDLEDLLKDKYQLSLGVRHRFDCCVVSFAVTENLQNLNNTPDIGFQVGFAWVPAIEPQRRD